MNKIFTCVMCPNGCDIEADVNGLEVISLTGALCTKGKEYVQQELLCPRRNIASSVAVDGGEFPLASVRLSAAIPKERIFDVMQHIKSLKFIAPVTIGTVATANILGLGVDLIITKNVKKTVVQ